MSFIKRKSRSYCSGFPSDSLESQLFSSVYAYLLAVTAETLELNCTVNHCEQCIVRTDTYTVTGMNVCTSLANQNIASLNELTVCSLYTQSFGLRITAVLCRTGTLLMSEELHTNLQHDMLHLRVLYLNKFRIILFQQLCMEP